MSEHEITEAMDAVQRICSQLTPRMLEAKQQGRMVQLDEARGMDALSRELMQWIQTLSQHPLSEIKSPELRSRVGEMLELAQASLAMVLRESLPEPRCTDRIPRAASSCLDAYCTY